MITEFKNNLSTLIKESKSEIPNNINNIKEMINDHFFFIDFIESMNIYENYKWEEIKITYNKVKKNKL